MATRALRFQLPVAREEELQGYLLTHFDVEGFEEAPDGSLICYIPDDEWTEDTKIDLGDFLSDHEDIELQTAEVIEQRDWNAEWESSIEPQKITEHLTITPSWKAEAAAAFGTEYTIVIDPKMSFGTGHHETTRLCLHAIERLPMKQQRVLDIGTGSGVLAIYALQRGAKHAVAVDTDEWSIDNAKENRTLNAIAESELDIRRGTLEETVKPGERFGVILANIHRNVLIDLASAIKRHLEPGGWLVLSGLLVYDGDEVRDAYEKVGLHFIQQDQENEWVALTFEVI
jgi:ribosomal protein L11 methyltransferase